MPVLVPARRSASLGRSLASSSGLVVTGRAPVYSLLVPSGAASESWLPRQPDHRPKTMLQPVSFGDEPTGQLRLVRLRPVDESEDHW
jgi:hypothetical protein